MKKDGEGEGGREQREGMDRKDCSCEVWRNSMLLQANCQLRHRGTDVREGEGGRRRREGERRG